MADDLSLSPEEKLTTLRELDILHQWESIDEKRFCRRCGQIISGREIKVFGDWRGEEGLHLECPTEDCPSVPIEWIMIEAPERSEAAARPEKERVAAPRGDGHRPRQRPAIFGFLRIAAFAF